MSDEEKVKVKWPDAELYSAFAVQPDKTRRWMWCVMSSLKFLASRGKKQRVLNVGSWRFSEADAWADASGNLTGGREGEVAMPKNKAIRTKASFKAAAMGYVDAQLAIMKKYGSEPKVLSPAEYYGLVDEIMVVGMRLWENSGGLVKE